MTITPVFLERKRTTLFMGFVLNFIILSSISASYAQSKKLKVLFIGNSYIYVNDLPKLISDLATSSGRQLTYSSSAPGGQNLQGHSTNPATLSLIGQGDWDYVVLQEQSQRPSFPDAQVAANVYPYARKLDSIIRAENPCAKTVFYMTWGRKNGDDDNCQFFPPLCTYAGMDSMLQLRYTIMADDNNATICPVARVWRDLRSKQPGIELYDADESHPSINGSFAAACAFYAILFRSDPALCTFNAGLSSSDAMIIKNTAKKIVFDSLNHWYRFQPLQAVNADYSHAITGNQVNFTNMSAGAQDYLWDFGDGSTATDKDPVHSYSANGNYQVKLLSGKCNDYDSITKMVNLTTAGINPVHAVNTVAIYPNPVNEFMMIQSGEIIEKLRVLNITGQIVHCLENIKTSTLKLSLDMIMPGQYFIELCSSNGKTVQKFSKL